jgi:hypothetical protein
MVDPSKNQAQPHATPPASPAKASHSPSKSVVSHSRIEELEAELEAEKKRVAAAESLDLKQLAGDLLPGEIGYIHLDPEGKPTGPAVREVPPVGTPCARVMGMQSYPSPQDGLVTPTGAPLTPNMNPFPDPRVEIERLAEPKAAGKPAPQPTAQPKAASS